jgi:ABC-type branched-subunit amino acid transport system ATPase component
MELTIDKLSKRYPNGVQALNGVSLNIPTGMFGLLGPNGAGKSTLMRILSTLLDADSGTVRLGELNVLTQKHERIRSLCQNQRDGIAWPSCCSQGLSQSKRATASCFGNARTCKSLSTQKEIGRQLLGRHETAIWDRTSSTRRPEVTDRGRTYRRSRSW